MINKKTEEKQPKQPTISGIPYEVIDCSDSPGFNQKSQFNRKQRRYFEAMARRSPNYKNKTYA